jgi:sortase A
MRRIVRSLGAVLILFGAGMLAWAGVTWLWKDPFTAAYTAREQRELSRAYERRAEDFPAPVLASADGGPAIAETARRYRRSLEPGDPVGRLRVPRLGLDMVVVEGTDPAPLKRGPGRHRDTFLPGEGELVYIAGHRTTYSAPFSRIDRLRDGDAVVLELPYGTFEYRIMGHKIVKATDVEVLRSKGREVIALQACHPRFFASHRYIAYAVPAESAR